jgi:Phosphatidylinositol 3- and 4-kinase
MTNKSYKSSCNFLHLEGHSLNISNQTRNLSKSDNLLKLLAAASALETRQISESEFYKTKTPNMNEQGEMRVDEIKSLTSYNEMIVYLFDNLSNIRNFFNIPLLEEDQLASFENVQEEKTSIGTYANLIYEASSQGVNKETLDSGFNIYEAQKFALLQLIIKAEDTHGGNIMIQVNTSNQLVPIPIDFGRCLGNDPHDEHMLPRTTRWEQWPALLYPIDLTIKDFILNLNIDDIVEAVRTEFFRLFSSLLSEEQINIFHMKFFHLHSNLVMIQEAVKAGLTIKQMLTLILPVIDSDAFHFVTQGVLQGGELWPARHRFATLNTSFLKAWRRSHQNDSFDKNVFFDCIKKEIIEIKNIPEDLLEKRYFQEMSFELRRGLFL